MKVVVICYSSNRKPKHTPVISKIIPGTTHLSELYLKNEIARKGWNGAGLIVYELIYEHGRKLTDQGELYPFFNIKNDTWVFGDTILHV